MAEAYIVLLVFAVAFSLWLGWYASNRLKASRAVRKMQHGVRQEQVAGEILKRKGYKILAFQKVFAYQLQADGKNVPVTFRCDFIVQKGRKTYVAEVKTGKSADVKNSATRRQMLEYAMFARADGILLVDADNKSIQKVEFPLSNRNNLTAIVLLLIILAAVVFLMSLIM